MCVFTFIYVCKIDCRLQSGCRLISRIDIVERQGTPQKHRNVLAFLNFEFVKGRNKNKSVLAPLYP